MFDNMSATTTVAIPERTRSRRTTLLAVLFVGFVLSGIATTIVGPMLPVFIRRWGLDDGQAGRARSASLLNLLNFTWGAGAMACSPLIAVALANNRLPSLLISYAIFGGLLAFTLLFARFGAEKHERAIDTSRAAPLLVGRGVTIALATLFFMYVCMETSIGVWSAEYSRRIANGITNMTTLAPMFFYAGLTSARLAIPFGRTVGDWRA